MYLIPLIKWAEISSFFVLVLFQYWNQSITHWDIIYSSMDRAEVVSHLKSQHWYVLNSHWTSLILLQIISFNSPGKHVRVWADDTIFHFWTTAFFTLSSFVLCLKQPLIFLFSVGLMYASKLLLVRCGRGSVQVELPTKNLESSERNELCKTDMLNLNCLLWWELPNLAKVIFAQKLLLCGLQIQKISGRQYLFPLTPQIVILILGR